ncbi:MAG: ADP-ribosylglycohydrolase family protein [Planctomycetota bacterium]|jgi:hypothetical protein
MFRTATIAVVVALGPGRSASRDAVAMDAGGGTPRAGARTRRITMRDYVDKMKAGWIGQMAGVSWGAPTEFKIKGKIMPESRVPTWNPGRINQFGQDDIYVEMTFMQTLDDYGFDVSIRQAGIDFANSGYRLWHANRAGRDNLRRGIAPPDSGHPQFNRCADDIDYQIEADYSGLIAPGMPQIVVELGEKFGRLMNYGDGVYGGQLVGAMYAEAFFETDVVKIIEAALESIPARSQYAEMVRDMLQWYREEPDDWQKIWHKLEEKYHKDGRYTHGKCSGPGRENRFSIDAKLNGAYILMGLLYGKGDLDKTIVISMRCGQDSDCNPSNAGGVLFTTLGLSKLPEKFTSALNMEGKFSHTRYDFPGLVEASKKLVRQAVVRYGGRVETDAAGEEVLVIPVKPVTPSRLMHVKTPGPVANSRFTEDEMARVTASGGRPGGNTTDISKAVAKFAPGWTVAGCGRDMDPGLKKRELGRDNVLLTHPLNQTTPCTLKRSVALPAGKRSQLKLVVGHYPRGDWTLVVKADGKKLLTRKISRNTTERGWATVLVDLSAHAGKTVKLELENRADGWSWEAGYWAEIAIERR